jgi:hypothetical protein
VWALGLLALCFALLLLLLLRGWRLQLHHRFGLDAWWGLHLGHRRSLSLLLLLLCCCGLVKRLIDDIVRYVTVFGL